MFVATLFVIAYMNFVRPARKHRKAALAAPAAPVAPPVPEPRVPRDTSRTYPRPKGSRSKLNRVCPVCGTGQATGILDGRVLGWPAHRTCAEWLGDWKPVVRGGGEYATEPARSGVGPVARVGSTNTVTYIGASSTTCGGGGAGGSSTNGIAFASPETMAITEQVKNGLISVGEARERLDREIVATFAVSPMALEEHAHKASDPLPTVRCTCGAQFIGTPEYLKSAMETHRRVGCRALVVVPPSGGDSGVQSLVRTCHLQPSRSSPTAIT